MGADTFGVRDPEIEQVMRRLAERINLALSNTGYGFALFLFETGKEGGNFFYIANAERESLIVALQAFIDRQKH